MLFFYVANYYTSHSFQCSPFFQSYLKEFDELPMKSLVLKQLVEWAKHIPHFLDLKVEDQVLKHFNSVALISC